MNQRNGTRALLVLLGTAALLCGGRGAGAAAAAYSEGGADTCLSCHDTPEVLSLFRTKHARPTDPRSPFGHDGLQCEACHGPGAAHASLGNGEPAGIVTFKRGEKAGVAKQNAMCLGCHRAGAAHEWAASVHAAGEVSCADCHRSHAAQDPVLQGATQAATCSRCHQAQAADMLKPSHHPLREGTMTCASCHSAHGSPVQGSLVKNTLNETCTSCHAEFRGPFLWEHQPVAEDCSNCHDPHGSAQPALLKLPVSFLCQQCHQAAGHPSAALTPRGLAGAMPDPSLLAGGCLNCHSQVHGSNHPSGRALMR
jgi:DmsE family decaheme c-type cytochrome